MTMAKTDAPVPAARINKTLEKDLDSRRRAAMSDESTHIRIGSWQGTDGNTVELVGHARDLHGTQCTCCARRTTAGAA